MAFEPKNAELEIKYTKALAEDSIPVVMTLQSGEGAISRVVSVSATPSVEQIIPSTGSVQIDGKLGVKIIVENVDGGYSCLEGANNFTIHNMNAEILPESEVFATAHSLGVNSVQASEHAVTFTTNILVKPIFLACEKVKYVSELSVAQQKRDSIFYTDIVAGTAQEFDLDIELDMPQSVSKVLCVESVAVLSKIESGNDVVSLYGEMYTNLVYLTSDEQPKLKNQRYNQSFTHELLANNITSSDVVTATMQTSATTYELQGELNSAKGTILLKNLVKTNIFVRQNKSIEAVVDAFCPKYLLNNEYSSFTSQNMRKTELNFEKIDGSIVLGEDSPRIDRILAVCSGNVITKSVDVGDKVINATGVLGCYVFYTLDDEEATTQSILAEVPFSLSLKKDELVPENFVKINIVPKDIEARNKKSKEIDILAELAIESIVLQNDNDAILQNVHLGEKRPVNNSAMGLYIIPEAKDLWDVSKSLAIPGELIIQQNPDLSFPITTPQRLIVYREKSV
ncbi:MAG: DUF3794 domain-containing protein [Clostridia bacterium]|nr:DUF3794 domain-containing protein [Clostridia bacterium]